MEQQYYQDQGVDNDMMRRYVNFICDEIRLECVASLSYTTGMPVKGMIPVRLEIVEKYTRSVKLKLFALNCEEEFIYYLSRKKGPEELLWQLNMKIDELVKQIIDTHGMNRDAICEQYDPIKIWGRHVKEKMARYEGIQVKILSGDRDWVGIVATIKNVKFTGECEVHSIANDYYNSNIKYIQLDPNGTHDGFEMIIIDEQ